MIPEGTRLKLKLILLEANMQLTYRGIKYNPSTTAEPTIPATNLKYRGASYRRNQTAMVQATNAVLKYRGTNYTPNASTVAAPVATPVAPVATPVALVLSGTVQDKARLLSVQLHREIKNRQQTMLQRAAASLGLDVNIADYWHHVQGKIPTSAWQTCDRSTAAMS